MSLLNQINSPKDVKAIPRAELPKLADEVRQKILSVISDKGGHLGASLGTVELTVALHAAFDAPRDRIVWDTGHQAYAHKLLTGRRDRFHTLRQHEGISGFLCRTESPYDTFGAGHAGTAISAALGMAEARDHLGGDYHVVAVVGDGAITAGIAYEALNHAGGLQKNLIVILNDNEMSISKNVGALSAYLTRMITDPLYMRVKSEVGAMMKNIPKIGKPMLKAVRRAEESMKGMLVPGLLFEELGFRYIGPIDGHRIDHMLTTFENVKQLRGPLLIHLVTKKGKGYVPAEADPVAYHGLSAFDLETGIAKKKVAAAPTYTGVFAERLIHLAKKDKKIVAITAGMPDGTGLNKFAALFPDRCYDVGIAEQHAVTLAAGMATEGLRPVVTIYSTFLQRAYDQIIHDVGIQNLPVVFCLDRAGLVGEDGPTHHGVFDLAYLRPIPNMLIMAPKDENELQHMMATALAVAQPAAIRYPRGEGLGVPMDAEPTPLPVGRGEVIAGDVEAPSDVAFIAIGNMVSLAQSAATLLAPEGIRTLVINARFVKPLDLALLVQVARSARRLVTLEDHLLSGGFGEAVLAALEDEKHTGNLPPFDLLRLGLPDQFIEHGAPKILRAQCGLTAQQVADTVRLLVKNEGEISRVGNAVKWQA
jgi:1-deoxy-D-xylulose-5-phosphate synthase